MGRRRGGGEGGAGAKAGEATDGAARLALGSTQLAATHDQAPVSAALGAPGRTTMTGSLRPRPSTQPRRE